jgi:hypothetical protein
MRIHSKLLFEKITALVGINENEISYLEKKPFHLKTDKSLMIFIIPMHMIWIFSENIPVPKLK